MFFIGIKTHKTLIIKYLQLFPRETFVYIIYPVSTKNQENIPTNRKLKQSVCFT